MSGRLHAEGGFGLIWTMLLLVLLSALAAAVSTRDQTMRRDAKTDEQGLRTRHAADGALAHARHALQRDPGYRGGTLRIGLTEVSIAITRPAPERWEVEIHAQPSGSRIDATITPTDGLPRVVRWTRR